jgi:lipoprotein-releasing system permease protein
MSNSRFAAKIALRYLRTKRSEAFINIISIISVLGVALGVAILIISMAIMTGFERELRNKVVGSAHIIITHYSAKLEDWTAIKDFLAQQQGVEKISAYTEHQALLSVQGRVQGVLVRGVEAKSQAENEISQYLSRPKNVRYLFEPVSANNRLPNGEVSKAKLPGVLIGKELALRLNIREALPISLMSPQVSSSPFGLMPRHKRFMVADVYSSGLGGYEAALVYMGLPEAQKFFRMHDAVSALELQLEKPEQAARISTQLASALESKFKQGYIVRDWTVQNQALWEAMKLEKRVYFIVLLLLIVLASFSIISTLVMIVLEKRKDIAVMRSFGARGSVISLIFRIQGMIIGLVGTASGLVLGWLGCWALDRFGFPLPENVFPTSTVPVQVEPLNFVIVAVSTLIICYLSTIYPARRASKLDPVEILRYE